MNNVIANYADDVDYGPLACLVGQWQGDVGMDVAPEPDGVERNPFYETITFEAAGDVDNAEQQFLAIVRYHQVVSRKTTRKVFHDESGYYTWDPATGKVVQSFAIPRGVVVVAGDSVERTDTGVIIRVQAAVDNPDWGITESPFMRDNASTRSFSHLLTVDGDQLTYEETTIVEIYGKTHEHTDQNQLQRVRID